MHNKNASIRFKAVKKSVLRNECKPIIALACDWLIDPGVWAKEPCFHGIVAFIEQTQGASKYPNMALIGVLAHQVDI
jgi:hypothetical protein